MERTTTINALATDWLEYHDTLPDADPRRETIMARLLGLNPRAEATCNDALYDKLIDPSRREEIERGEDRFVDITLDVSPLDFTVPMDRETEIVELAKALIEREDAGQDASYQRDRLRHLFAH